jgi:VWFA-related protein
MRMVLNLRFGLAVMFTALMLSSMVLSQETKDAATSAAPNPAAANPRQTQAIPVIKATTRMVTVQVLVRDRSGHPVTGLGENVFQVFEQVPPKKDQRPQKIAAFQFVSVAAIAAGDKGIVAMPAGVYSNLVSMQKKPVPPTVLLVDGLNTSVAAQQQVHRQMVKMLQTIPDNVPVSVFLLDRQLHLLQDFTTDPTLLKTAAAKAFSLDAAGLADVDPSEDPEALSAQLVDVPGAPMEALARFERETFAATMDIRVQATLDAFRAIARHLSGYPGRKNLLWVSSSFPIQIAPDDVNKFNGLRNYDDRTVEVTNALSDARVAVYPLDAGGLQTQSYFNASTRVRGTPTARSMGNSIQHEDVVRFSKQESMTMLADGTGGRICVNDNDLSDCVKKSMDDGASYYELAYYPDSANWEGEFHRIVVKTTHPGVSLSYRRGYYSAAGTKETDSKDEEKLADRELKQAACVDLLTSTALLVVARSMPADKPDQARYFLAIDPKLLTFAPGASGGRVLRMNSAVCTFNKKGKALQYFSDRTEQPMTDEEFSKMTAHAVPHAIQFPAAPDVTRVRLVVRDSGSGAMGSVDVPVVK